MAAILPLVFFAITAWRAYRIHPDGKAAALLRAAVTWGTASVIIVELLSLVRALSPLWIAFAWSLGSLGFLFSTLRTRWQGGYPSPHRRSRAGLLTTGYLRPYLTGLTALVLSVGIAAVLSPPGPVDVHRYHMPRVLFWLQNRQVAHYPTTNHQQLFQPPWAEQAALHLYALTPGDRFVNLVHFASYVGSGIAAVCVTAELGAGRLEQLTAAAFALTLPQAILTASGTKNDLTVAFWTLVALYFALRYVRTKRANHAVYLGLAGGLAILTKATAYIWLLCVPVVVGSVYFRRGSGLGWGQHDGRKNCVLSPLRAIPLVVFIALSLSVPHYLRNERTFGSPLGCASAMCGDFYKFANDGFSPRLVIANVLRNLTLHATTPVPELNRLAYHSASKLVKILGVDPQDPRITWTETKFSEPAFRMHEALAGNPLHLLMAVGLVGTLVVRRDRGSGAVLGLFLAAVVSFVVFCGVFRWQPWHSRLHAPFFMLLACFVGCAAERTLGRRGTLAVVVLLLMCSVPYAVGNEIRPLVTSGGTLFGVSRDQLYPHAKDVELVTRALKKTECRQVALDVGSACEIYPLLHRLNIGLGPIKAVYLAGDARFHGWYAQRPVNVCAVIYTDHTARGYRGGRWHELGKPVMFESLGLVTGFTGAWSPQEGWRIGNEATPAAQAGGTTTSGPVRLPASMRPDNPSDLNLLKGVWADGWVSETGIRLALLTGGAGVINVTILGEVPAWANITPQVLTLRCGDEPPRTEEIRLPGQFKVSSELPCAPAAVVELLVQPARTFRPLDAGINQDPRLLAFLLHSLTVTSQSK